MRIKHLVGLQEHYPTQMAQSITPLVSSTYSYALQGLQMPNIKIPALLAAISSPSFALAIDFTEADMAWRKQSALKDQASLDYMAERINYYNSIRLDEKGNCYTKAKGEVTLILVTNKQGVIESVASDVTNEKSKCFINTYLGSTYKAPPIAPFYDKLIMGH